MYFKRFARKALRYTSWNLLEMQVYLDISMKLRNQILHTHYSNAYFWYIKESKKSIILYFEEKGMQ